MVIFGRSRLRPYRKTLNFVPSTLYLKCGGTVELYDVYLSYGAFVLAESNGEVVNTLRADAAICIRRVWIPEEGGKYNGLVPRLKLSFDGCGENAVIGAYVAFDMSVYHACERTTPSLPRAY